MIALGTPELPAALDVLRDPGTNPQRVDWVDWQAWCPCGRLARWYARRVVDATGDLRPVCDGRQVSVEYRIDCACSAAAGTTAGPRGGGSGRPGGVIGRSRYRR